MPNTAEQYQNLILMEIGEPLAGGPVSESIAVIWGMFADKALLAPRLQYLYVKAKAIEVKLGAIADGAYTPVGIVQNKALDDKAAFWSKERDKALGDALALETRYARLRAVVSGTLTTTAPISPDDDSRTIGAPDANNREYRGDAYLNTPYDRGGGRVI